MGQLVLTEPAATQFLLQQIGLEQPESIWLRLYGNPYRPSRYDNLLNYTECGGHDYEPILIQPTDWRLVRLEHGLVGVITPPLIWTFGDGPPMRIYGSYATGARRTRLLYWGDPLDDGFVTVTERGQQLEIQPCLIRALPPDPTGG